MNVDRKENFTQVCVWPGTVVGEESIADFQEWFLEEFGTRVQYLEEVVTAPDLVEDVAVPGTGGRNDVFFAVHDDDIGKFAVPRLSVGIRWLEDIYGNGHGHIYPERVADYKSWSTGSLA